MKQSQIAHISMINSYNVLVEKINIDKIILSGLGTFSHSVEEKDAKKSVEFMIKYFQDMEMYEKCAGLQKYIDETFDEDGNYIENICNCEYPDIKEYNPIPICLICNTKLSRL